MEGDSFVWRRGSEVVVGWLRPELVGDCREPTGSQITAGYSRGLQNNSNLEAEDKYIFILNLTPATLLGTQYKRNVKWPVSVHPCIFLKKATGGSANT